VQRALLRCIPGADDRIAITIIAEIGTDMSVFGNAAWTGICPGNYESAGRQKKNKARRGNVHLKTALVTAAIGAARQKGSYYKDKYHRLKARRGPGRAAVAIAHKILVAVYNMLSTSTPFRQLGEGFLDQQARKRTITNLVQRLTSLGYGVALCPKPA
jgi:transposase